MHPTLSHRATIFLAMISVLIVSATCFGCSPAGTEITPTFADAIAALEQETGGTVGLYALDTGTGRELAHRADERFATASTFKPLLVAAVLADVDAGTRFLDDTVNLHGVQVQPYSPVIEKRGDRPMTLAELCEAAITLGDNTATNVLLDLVGGPAALTQFLRAHGDDTTRLDRYETELNNNERGDERDTTTPRAMGQSLRNVLFSELLSEASRQRLQGWLVASKTGGARLRAGLPGDWRVGDKTGTGMHGAVNDVAVAWPPGRPPLIIVVYLSWSDKDMDTLNAVHATIAAMIAEELGRTAD